MFVAYTRPLMKPQRKNTNGEKLKGIYFVRYEHHYVFFRELTKEVLGVVNVLHESMDIPNRLKEDLNAS
jgi:plasmid stabilization system protein ParE